MTAQPPLPAQHVGQERRINAVGRTWTITRWDRAAWRKFLAWAATLIPDPRETAKGFLAMLPDTPENVPARQMIVAHAIDRYQPYLSENSSEVQQLLNSLEGSSKILEILLHKHHPEEFPVESTEQSMNLAYDIALEITLPVLSERLKEAAGVAPAPKDDTESQDSQSSAVIPFESIGLKLTPVSSERPA